MLDIENRDRAKLTMKNRNAYGTACKIGDRYYILLDDAQISDTGPRGIEVAGFVEVDPKTIGQKSSYIDRLGTPIYEGDRAKTVLHFEESGDFATNGIIDFYKSSFRFLRDNGGFQWLHEIIDGDYEIEIITEAENG